MTVLFSVIFILSIAGGILWGYINDLTAAGYVISIAAAGFVGSSIIALVFSYLYFFGDTQHKNSIPPDTPDSQNKRVTDLSAGPTTGLLSNNSSDNETLKEEENNEQ